MRHTEAAEQSELKIGQRVVNIDTLELFDAASQSFFLVKLDTQPEGEDEVIRKPGRGSTKKDDWIACTSEAYKNKVEAWKAESEERGLVIEKPWEDACMKSPVNRAMRQTKRGEFMVRLSDKSTWVTSNKNWIYPIGGGVFKLYDGWEPVPEDHVFAKIPFTGTTGYNVHAFEARQEKPRLTVEKKTPKNPDAEPVAVPVEAITAAASIAQSLGESLKYCKEEDYSKVLEEMLRLSKSVSWHLREDRRRYQ